MQIAALTPSITSAAALAAVQAAVEHGRAMGKAVVAAVVDGGGDLMACLRADGAFSVSIGIARDKAYTAAVFGVASHELGQTLSSSAILRDGIAMRPGVILFAGGLPISVDGAVAGAIGVSGGSEDDDLACAKAGLIALGLPAG